MANVFDAEWELERGGVSMASITSAGGAELLGATVYELEPGARLADLHVHFENESEESARVLIVSTLRMPEVVDSGARRDLRDDGRSLHGGRSRSIRARASAPRVRPDKRPSRSARQLTRR